MFQLKPLLFGRHDLFSKKCKHLLNRNNRILHIKEWARPYCFALEVKASRRDTCSGASLRNIEASAFSQLVALRRTNKLI